MSNQTIETPLPKMYLAAVEKIEDLQIGPNDIVVVFRSSGAVTIAPHKAGVNSLEASLNLNHEPINWFAAIASVGLALWPLKFRTQARQLKKAVFDETRRYAETGKVHVALRLLDPTGVQVGEGDPTIK